MNIQPLKNAFRHLSKQGVFRQSQLFFEVNTACKKYFDVHNLGHVPFTISVTESPHVVQIALSISNKTFSTWLKTEADELQDFLTSTLHTRGCLDSAQTCQIRIR